MVRSILTVRVKRICISEYPHLDDKVFNLFPLAESFELW